jgi:hypothetical protein
MGYRSISGNSIKISGGNMKNREKFLELASAAKKAIEDFNDFADDRAIAWAFDEIKELKQLEKQYSQTLGRMAQLRDVVCPWVLKNPPELTPIDVAKAAAEIMEYVKM